MTESNLDILITRVIDQRATAADWTELEGLALTDPSVWRELAMAQKDEAAFAQAVGQAVSVAERVELPVELAFPLPVATQAHAEVGVRNRMRLVGAWGGWAAAAMVALAVIANKPGAGNPGPAIPTQHAGLDGLLSQYLNEGKKAGSVVGELPDKVVLDSIKTADGQTEITYVRQIVEKARVDDLYRMTVDEAGNAKPVKVRITVTGRNKSAM